MVRFIVIDENVLGYVNDLQPTTVGILAASPIRGAVHNWMDGTMLLPANPARYRPAKRADFAQFYVAYDGYNKHPERYDFPAE